MSATLRCPTCGHRFEYDAGHVYRPFCSERCRLIDLGAWLKEEHRIAGSGAPEEALQAGANETAPQRASSH